MYEQIFMFSQMFVMGGNRTYNLQRKTENYYQLSCVASHKASLHWPI